MVRVRRISFSSCCCNGVGGLYGLGDRGDDRRERLIGGAIGVDDLVGGVLGFGVNTRLRYNNGFFF